MAQCLNVCGLALTHHRVQAAHGDHITACGLTVLEEIFQDAGAHPCLLDIPDLGTGVLLGHGHRPVQALLHHIAAVLSDEALVEQLGTVELEAAVAGLQVVHHQVHPTVVPHNITEGFSNVLTEPRHSPRLVHHVVHLGDPHGEGVLVI
ncbi:MAG: hypothetical protein ACK559_27110, partial [bacterium]